MNVETIILVIVVLTYVSRSGIIHSNKPKVVAKKTNVVVVENNKNNNTAEINLPKIPLEISAEKIKNFILKMNKNISEKDASSMAETIIDESKKANIDARLVTALICKESTFNSQAVSSSGALGLGQLLPQTAKEVGVNNPLDPVQNIKGTVEYLRRLFLKWVNYDDVVERVLASYRVGHKVVEQNKGVPQTKEVQSFIAGIKKFIEMIED